MNSIVINYSKGKHGVVRGCSEGYSAVAQGIDTKHIICKVSASALFRWNHDSIGPVPVKSGVQSNPQGLTATDEGRGAVLRLRCGVEPTEEEPGL